MKYIQTLFIRDDQNPFVDTFGWVSPCYHLMGLTLSCLTLKKQLGYLYLYCNRRARELLIDVLELPYDEVHESMNDLRLHYPQLRVLSKIHTYAQQKEPFLHIEGDVFLFERFPERITSGSVVAQNIERLSDCNLHAFNTGILGGCSVDFFQRYFAEAFKYMKVDIACLTATDARRFNIFLENILCYNMSKEENITVEYLLPQTYNDNSFLGLDKFHEILSGKSRYFHLSGKYKADEFTCRQMAKVLHTLYPQYFYRIIALFPELAKEYDGIQYHSESERIYLSNSIKGNNDSAQGKIFTWKPKNLNQISSKDYDEFAKKINIFLQKSNSFSKSYLNGRDALSFYWYHRIMEEDQIFETSPVIEVIKSAYDWARLFREYKSFGMDYNTTDCGISVRGNYYSLIISELNPDGFSLFDIDEFEAVILTACQSPVDKETLIDYLNKVEDSEIKEQPRTEFKTLIFERLKHLILMKAIQPVG
ncbi:MAG: hypothetical protein K2K98_02955 [Muribaculaceae bacterium]|nr:hypothetical protein [Muribaculaceae bacterium]